MKMFYSQLSPNKRRSINYSMKIAVKEFLEEYKWNLSTFKTTQDALENLYFYWFKKVAERGYLWCEEFGEEFFYDEFVSEMRVRLNLYFCKMIKEKGSYL